MSDSMIGYYTAFTEGMQEKNGKVHTLSIRKREGQALPLIVLPHRRGEIRFRHMRLLGGIGDG